MKVCMESIGKMFLNFNNFIWLKYQNLNDNDSNRIVINHKNKSNASNKLSSSSSAGGGSCKSGSCSIEEVIVFVIIIVVKVV